MKGGRLVKSTEMDKDKITVKEIEQPIRIAEDEDILDIILENTTDKLLDRLGVKLWGHSPKEARKAVKRFLLKLPLPRVGLH